MCGIAGFIDLARRRGAEQNDALATAMHEAIRRRGPDAGTVWSDPARGVWFGHRRLAIIDLSPAGAQPMATSKGTGVIAYNGEAYDVGPLRQELMAAGYVFRGHSDTEVVVDACEHLGVDAAVKRLTGFFAFAYWDKRTGKLTLACDRLGKKPLYWTQTAGSFLFASELLPLMLHPDCPRAVDRDSVADFLRLSYVPAPHSILLGVQKLEPGHLLEFDPATGAVDIRCYWSVAQAAQAGLADPFAGTPDEAVDATQALLEDAVAIRMVSDVPLGSFLSGGVDSSTVTALMQKGSSRPVRTFSVGFREAGFDESEQAAAVARHLGTEHEAFMLEGRDALDLVPELPSFYDEPFADASQLPTYLVARAARKHVTVALSGDGGDEVFAGYNRHVQAGRLARLSALPGPLRWALAGAVRFAGPRLLGDRPAAARARKLADVLTLSEADQYQSLITYWPDPDGVTVGGRERGLARGDPTVLPLLPDVVARMRYLDMTGYLPGDILTKVDRATMAVSLEARAPLLDHRLVEFSWRLASGTLLNHGQGKWILKEILARHVPRALFERPKAGFTPPVGEWLRGPLRDWAEGLLSVEALEEAGLLRPEPVRAAWERHLERRANAERELWPVLMLQAWRRRHAPYLTGG